MGWIIAILVVWILMPFVSLIISIINGLIKWIILFIYFIVDCFKR